MDKPADYDHLMQHAQRIFPSSYIDLTYSDDEIIHMDVDGHRFTFEIGSDDDAYVFDDGKIAFSIPLLEIPDWP